MKIRTYPLLFTDCQNSVGKYFLDGGGRAIPPPRVAEDPQTPGLNRVNTEFGLPTRVFVFPVVQWQLNPINLNQGSQLEVNLSPTFIKRIKLSFNILETSKATITCKWKKMWLTIRSITILRWQLSHLRNQFFALSGYCQLYAKPCITFFSLFL